MVLSRRWGSVVNGFMLVLFFVTLFSACRGGEAVKYGTGTWDRYTLGNHRAVVRVDRPAETVLARIPWRRRDLEPQKKNIVVVDAASEQVVKNVFLININREFGELIFQAVSAPGNYFVYYMPFSTSGRQYYPKVTYNPPVSEASEKWLQDNYLGEGGITDDRLAAMTQAELVEIQSINAYNSFYPMEVIATGQEMRELLAASGDRDFLIFPEDRKNPIRMTGDLPQKWIQTGPGDSFSGEAYRGECYAFQLGLFAARVDLVNVRLTFPDLTSRDGKTKIAAHRFSCINLGGTNWTGLPLKKELSVNSGKIQPLWIYLQVPEDISAQTYSGNILIEADGTTTQELSLKMKVQSEVLDDAGDSEPWRQSRLRWLDSRIAIDDEIVAPFSPLQIDGNTVNCLGRKVTVAPDGFPAAIEGFFSMEMTRLSDRPRPVLTAPISLIAEGESGLPLKWERGSAEINQNGPGRVNWKSSNRAGDIEMLVEAQMEFDGNIEFEVTLSSKKDVSLKDVRLEIPIQKEVARYILGLGIKGGFRPVKVDWKWNWKNNQDSVWLGDINAGLQCSFKDTNYERPLNTNFYLSKPLNLPPSWYNGGQGGIRIGETGKQTVTISAYSGKRSLKAGQDLHFNFRLLLTPFKLLDPARHFSTRYYHRYNPVDAIAAEGANTINVHHATEINPYINYPFLKPELMKAYIDEAHRKGLKVKIYYTVRELANRAAELFALRSLGDEILSFGPGGGFSWLQEHLGGNYIAGWLVTDLTDAAVINSGVSRWHNYYLEGLNWLVKEVGIDGLYIDDVAFDRTIMKRVRKILDSRGQGALIDLHSANQFNVRDGYANSANLYMEHFPYLDRLWFGEYFDYDFPAEFWLTEVSGIPFGLMGEMLQGGGNVWRGMLYGMTSRLPWAGNPKPMWRVWDDFGISESRMIGYWVPDNPIKTGRKDILATVYLKEKRALIVVAGWADSDQPVQLKINWDRIGISPESCRIWAPAIEEFQLEAEYRPGASIVIPQGEGRLLIVSESV